MTAVNRARKDRTIRQFTPPLNESPYREQDFSPAVRNACLAKKTGTVGLKVSKMIVVGDVSVGKTSLVNRFCHECFDRDYKATIGVDFEVERFDILSVPFNLQIWDTAGQERFRCIASAYYRGAHVVVIVFDLMDPYSLESVSRWHEEALRENSGCVHLFLVGTKKDLCSKQQFQEAEERGFKMAQQIQAEYWVVSSLTGENVTDFFFRVACITFNAAVSREVDDMDLKSKKIAVSTGSHLIKLNKPGDLDASLNDNKCSC
ncbi:ras-related protein Rab-34-like [Acanthaster planci]|uniref:Ras-related protein Rab-36 n=1 Tax=Acanthaster planci TaxID=133434 RepID=A0A8B7XY64_ACAPL|nr:ras-related protein Rab-34-like [Acanthaster planci]